MQLDHHGLSLELLPDHAVHHPDSGSLVVADLHLGKAGAFRAHGLAVPDGDDARDLGRLRRLVDQTRAAKLIIAGDLFHSSSPAMPAVLDRLARWCDDCPAEPTLVIGNHDRRAISKAKLPFESAESLDLGPIRVVHDPGDSSAGPSLTLCGHLHPVIRIRDGKRTSIRNACFWLAGNTLTLPAFGSFTGGRIIHPGPGDRIFIPIRDRIAEVPPECWK
jgi:DNA ligase-associated metallophosphoesterase